VARVRHRRSHRQRTRRSILSFPRLPLY
jgi:hypothetical protein